MADPIDDVNPTIDKQPDTAQQSAEPAQSNPPVETPKVINAVETPKPATEQQLNEVKHEMNVFERSTIRWMRTTAGIGAVTAAFICLQWCEMKSGGVDTRHLAEAASGQYGAMVELAHAASGQAGSMQLFADRMRDQADNTRRAVAISREALESVQRAFVLFGQNLQQNFVFDAAGQTIVSWEFRPRIENSGVTPTVHAVNHINFLHTPTTIPETFPLVDQPATSLNDIPFVLGPKETFTGATAVVSPLVIDNVVHHTERLYFWGWATYRDVFPDTSSHIAMFCIELSELRGGDLKTGNNIQLVWSLCGRHNCAVSVPVQKYP